MKRFVYIEARDVSMPEDNGVILSFAGVVVSAPDEDTAYAEGFNEMRARAADDDTGHFSGLVMNDFVMEIPS